MLDQTSLFLMTQSKVSVLSNSQWDQYFILDTGTRLRIFTHLSVKCSCLWFVNRSSIPLCVCVSSSCLHLMSSSSTNSMKEVIIGRSRALPGGTTCIWIQALALSQDLSCILYHYASYFRLCFSLLHSPSLSYIHSHYAYSSDCIINIFSFPFWNILHHSSFDSFFPESPAVCSLQCKCTPPPPLPTPNSQLPVL